MKDRIEINHTEDENGFTLTTQKIKTQDNTFKSPEVAEYAIEQELDEVESRKVPGNALATVFAGMGIAALAIAKRDGAAVALLSAGMSSTVLIISHDKSRRELLQQQLNYVKNLLNEKE